MHRGYIKLWRKLQDNDLWNEEKFTRGQAWVDLVLLANHKDGHIRIRGNRVAVKRGQCGYSTVKLAARWRWSRGKVIRFLKELEKAQQIVQQKNYVTSLIQIINYDDYQGGGTADSTADGQQTDSRRYTNKNEKNEKNDKNKPIEGVNTPSPPQNGGPPCPHQKIIDLYHNTLPQLPQVRVWPEHLQKILRARWKEDKERQDLNWWARYFKYVAESDFLMGRANDGRFQADMEWVVRPKNMAKIANGRYHNRRSSTHCNLEAFLNAMDKC